MEHHQVVYYFSGFLMGIFIFIKTPLYIGQQVAFLLFLFAMVLEKKERG